MRILHVTPYYLPAHAWGGVVSAVSGLAQAQARAGHEVAVLTTDTLAPGICGTAGQERLEGIEVERVATFAPWVRARLNLSLPRRFTPACRARVRGVDVVHCHELRTTETLVASRVAVASDVPVILSPHGTLPLATGRGALKRVWDRLVNPRLLPRIRHVVALTAEEAAAAHCVWQAAGLELSPATLSIIPNGVDLPPEPSTDARHAARRRLGLEPADEVVLVLGRLEARKRVPLVVAAVARLVAARPRLRLVVAGPDAGDRSAVDRAVRNAGLEGRIVLPGLVTGAARRDVLVAADVLTVVGRGEGMSMAALEGLAAGLPVVTTPGGGLDDLGEQGAGVVVAADPVAVGDGVDRALAAAETMGRAARELVVRRYAWPTVVRRFDETFDTFVESRPETFP